MADPETVFAQTFRFDEAQAVPVTIEVAGMPVAFLVDDSVFAEQLCQEYAAFLSDARPIVRVPVHLDNDLRLDDELEQTAAAPYATEDGQHRTLAWRGIILVGDVEWQDVRVVQRAESDCFENVLRIFYSIVLVERGGFLLHAAGVAQDGEGYVFYGKSGSGKTTTARLSNPRPLLSDDMVAITLEESGRFLAWGTPFGGEERAGRQNRAVPLKRIFLLKQDEAVAVKEMGQREIVTSLLASVVNYSFDLGRQTRILDRCLALAQTVDGGALHFRREPSFWGVIANAP